MCLRGVFRFALLSLSCPVALAYSPLRIMRSEIGEPSAQQLLETQARLEPVASHAQDLHAQQQRAAEALAAVQRAKLGQQAAQLHTVPANVSAPPRPIVAVEAESAAARSEPFPLAGRMGRAAQQGATKLREQMRAAMRARASALKGAFENPGAGGGGDAIEVGAEPLPADDGEAGQPGAKKDAGLPERPACVHPLPLVGPGTMPVVPDTSISASSYLFGAKKHGKDEMFRSRLYSKSAWTAEENETSSFIQWDLGGAKYIMQLWLQGHAGQEQWWVTNFTLAFSLDALRWEDPQEEFPGSVDQNAITQVVFDAPFTARYVRLHPTAYVGQPSLRADLLGCAVPDLTAEARCQTRKGVSEMEDVKVAVTSSSGGHDLTFHSRITDRATGWVSRLGAKHQWLQWDLGAPMLIESIRTTGIPHKELWVARYDFAYSTDGDTWSWYDRDFRGNQGDSDEAVATLERGVEARYVRVFPTKWNGDVGLGLRAELEGCAAPQREIKAACPPQDWGPLIGGAAKPIIADAAIATSSVETPDGDTQSQSRDQQSWCSRIDCKGDSWTAAVADRNQWIIFDLGKLSQVGKIETRGRHNMEQWVAAFTLSYSGDGTTWVDLSHVYTGNDDRETTKDNVIDPPITARYVRINPTEWNDKISMRVELLGCAAPKEATCAHRPLVGTRANKHIKDTAITASSYFGNSPEYGADGHMWRARLDNTKDKAWKPLDSDDEPWIQFDFSSPRIISKVITARSSLADSSLEQITTFQVNYSNAGSVWRTAIGVFNATGPAGATEMANEIVPPITATVVRLLPIQLTGDLTLRAEFIGCAGSPADDTGADKVQPLAEASSTLKTSLAFARELINLERQALCEHKEIVDPQLVADSAQVQVALETIVTMTLRFKGGNEHHAKVKWASFGETSPLRSQALVQVQKEFADTHLIGSIAWLVLNKPACMLEDAEAEAPVLDGLEDESLVEQQRQAPSLRFASSVLLEREVAEYAGAVRRQAGFSAAAADGQTKGFPVHVASNPPRYAPVSALAAAAGTAPIKQAVVGGVSALPSFNEQLPRSFSWRRTKQDCFTYVHNQGSCGSGYMFAAIDSISDRHCIMQNECTPEPFSVMMALQCEEHGRQCAGGTAAAAFDTAQEVGLHFESAWPYESDCLSRKPCPRGGRCNKDTGRPSLESRCASTNTGKSLFSQDEARNIETFEDAMLIAKKLCQATQKVDVCRQRVGARFRERGLTLRFDLADEQQWCSETYKMFADFLHGVQPPSQAAVPALLEVGIWPFDGFSADPDASPQAVATAMDPDSAPAAQAASAEVVLTTQPVVRASPVTAAATPAAATAQPGALTSASPVAQLSSPLQSNGTAMAGAPAVQAPQADGTRARQRNASVAPAASVPTVAFPAPSVTAHAAPVADAAPQANATAVSVVQMVPGARPVRRSTAIAQSFATVASRAQGNAAVAAVPAKATAAAAFAARAMLTPPGALTNASAGSLVRASSKAAPALSAVRIAAVADTMPHPARLSAVAAAVSSPSTASRSNRTAASSVQQGPASQKSGAKAATAIAESPRTKAASAQAAQAAARVMQANATTPAALQAAAAAAVAAVLEAMAAPVTGAVPSAPAAEPVKRLPAASASSDVPAAATPPRKAVEPVAAVIVDDAPEASRKTDDFQSLLLPALKADPNAALTTPAQMAKKHMQNLGCIPRTQRPNRSQVCSRASCTAEAASFHLQGYHYVVKSVDAFKLELMQRGPFYVSFKVMEDFMSFFSQFPTRAYTHAWGDSLGAHAATLVGWDTECKLRPKSMENAAQGAEIPDDVSLEDAAIGSGSLSDKLDKSLAHSPEAPKQAGSYSRSGHGHDTPYGDCWELRNSFGEDWASNGYFRMEIDTLVGPLGLAGVAADL